MSYVVEIITVEPPESYEDAIVVRDELSEAAMPAVKPPSRRRRRCWPSFIAV